MARSQRTKLVLKDLGEPAIIKTFPDSTTTFMLGTLGGIATGFVERKSPDGTDMFEGLAGSFRSIPSDPTKDELESGVLFIPDAFHQMIATPLREMLKNDPNANLRFAFEVSVIRAKNPQGYSWDFRPKIEAAAANPLDELFDNLGGIKTIDGKRVLAISDKSAKPATATPQVAAAGGKK
jgi:hypothetical protein